MEIKPRLMKILKERGLTQDKLSEQSGVPQSAISRFDRSTQHTDKHLFAIARALNINVEELFEVVE